MPSGTNFRWTNDDMEADLPARFDRALEQCGFSFAGAVRAMIRGFTEEVEEKGPPGPIMRGIERAKGQRPTRMPAHMLNEPEGIYGSRPKGKKRKG
jgi:hypothetical protein